MKLVNCAFIPILFHHHLITNSQNKRQKQLKQWRTMQPMEKCCLNLFDLIRTRDICCYDIKQVDIRCECVRIVSLGDMIWMQMITMLAEWAFSLSIHLSVCFCVDGENRTTCFTISPTLFWQRATGVNGALCVRVYGKTSILFSMSPFANFRMGFVCTPFSKRNFSSFVMLSFCPHRNNNRRNS